MAYITNEGARLIERASSEGKSIVFGSVRMNTTYKSDPASLVQQSEEWFGENHGSVVGCLSHVSVDDVSQVCDSKLAVQCNDNSKAWKSIGIYAHLDGEEGEELFACESIQNGGYEDVTIVEIPVTLDGVVADFGLSEGGSGGGGGGEVPANMMTTDTYQDDLTGGKTWEWMQYEGGGTEEAPQEGDRRTNESISIVRDDGTYTPLIIDRIQSTFRSEGFWEIGVAESLKITASGVRTIDSFATWADVINAANSGSSGGGGGGGDVPANMMTTDTEQTGLTGTKTWTWQDYEGTGSLGEPHDGDRRTDESFYIGVIEGNHVPLAIDSEDYQYSTKEGWYRKGMRHLRITSDGVKLEDSFASWSNIINTSRVESGFDHVTIEVRGDVVYINDAQVNPNSEIKIGTYVFLVIDGNGAITSIHANSGSVLDISAAVFGGDGVHRVVGLVSESSGLSFDAPITPAVGQKVYFHWTRYVDNI